MAACKSVFWIKLTMISVKILIIFSVKMVRFLTFVSQPIFFAILLKSQLINFFINQHRKISGTLLAKIWAIIPKIQAFSS